MIGVDTNVLVRLVVSDSADQATAARVLIEEAETGGQAVFVNRVVLAEFLWVLASQYRVSKSEALAALEALTRRPVFRCEDREAVIASIGFARRGRQQITDLIVAETNKARGCDATYTFDRMAARVKHFTLLQ
jgi:predicted nucleic-acid-binding protein